ncbi:unnamed protein product, partial [Heterosigma akashiwo]
SGVRYQDGKQCSPLWFGACCCLPALVSITLRRPSLEHWQGTAGTARSPLPSSGGVTKSRHPPPERSPCRRRPG